jgi:hypothetical protein
VRLTAHGRALLSDEPAWTAECSAFIDDHTLRIGGETRVAQVLALSPFAHVGRVVGKLDIAITPAGIARAIAEGVTSETIHAAVTEIAPIPASLDKLLTQAGVVLGRAELVVCEGFLWVDDAELLHLLRTRKATAELFVDPSPPGGLLVRPSVDLERLAKRCRSLGIELHTEGQTLHAHRASRSLYASTPNSKSTDDRDSGTFDVKPPRRKRHSG